MVDYKLNKQYELNGITVRVNRMVATFLKKFTTVELGLEVKPFDILCLSF